MPASALLASTVLRVASLNLCADEYLLLLARPGEAVSTTFLSHDPAESPLHARAKRLPANDGSIEAVVKDRPDVVLTMDGGSRDRIRMAARLGIRLVRLPEPSSPADVAANVRRVAFLLGDPRRAEPWLRRFRAFAGLPRASRPAAFLGAGGLTLSPQSLGARWMALAGFRQVPSPGGRIDLERLLADPPPILLVSNYRRKEVSSGQRWLDHPIVRRARSKRIAIDGRAWTCGGPLMLEAVERLRSHVG